jgi:hypothetical protein
MGRILRPTLDKAPRSRDQWIQAILLIGSLKNCSQGLIVQRPKSDKVRLNLHGTCFEGKINWFGPTNSAERRAPDLENQESGYEPRYRLPQRFNLLQISPNWFLGNWTLDPRLKWALSIVAFISLSYPNLAKLSYGWLPPQLATHKRENKERKKKKTSNDLLSTWSHSMYKMLKYKFYYFLTLIQYQSQLEFIRCLGKCRLENLLLSLSSECNSNPFHVKNVG